MDGQTLYAETSEKDGSTLLRLEGVIDENSSLHLLLADVSGRNVVISPAGVTRINSCGVRDWVRWLASLEQRNNTIYIVSAPPVFVNQINPVRNFCGERGVVLSSLGPYFCESCGEEHLEALSTSALPDNLSPPEVLCASCAEPLVFDDVPETFFAFAAQHRAKAVPFEILQIVEGFDTAHIFTKVTELKELSPRLQRPT